MKACIHNFQTNLVIVIHALLLLFWNFINTIAYHLGQYEDSSTSTKGLHGLSHFNRVLPGNSMPIFSQQYFLNMLRWKIYLMIIY